MSKKKRKPKEIETSHPDIIIRLPVADDIQQAFDLLMRCKIPEYGLDALREEWREIDLTQQAWLAFTNEDSLVGYATATPYHTGLCYHVYVDPTWEGTAVNRMLLQECDRWGSKQIVFLGVAPINHPRIFIDRAPVLLVADRDAIDQQAVKAVVVDRQVGALCPGE